MTPSKGSTVIRPIRTVLLVTVLSVVAPVSAASAATGDVDTYWGNGGVPYAPVDAAQQLLSDGRGRLVTVTNRDREQVARLRHDGTLDAFFAWDGSWTDGAAGAAAVTPDDGVVSAAGVNSAYVSPHGVVVHRWRADGTAETGFDEDGEAFVPLPLPHVGSAAALADGSVLVSGSSQQEGVHRTFVLKLTPAGTLDPTWAADSESPGIAWGTGGAVVLEPLPGGGALASCYRPVSCLQRLLPDGRLDPSYGDGGTATGIGDDHSVHIGAVLVAPDGAATVVAAEDEDVLLVRYDPQGRIDVGFGQAGQARHPIPSCAGQGDYCTEYVRDAVVDSSGRMYVATFGGGSLVYRLNPDASLDRRWGLDGMVWTERPGDDATGLALDPTGRLFIAWDGIPTAYQTGDSAPRPVEQSEYGDLVQTPPQRILDTRSTRSPLASGGRVALDLAAALGVEPSEIRGALLNVTLVPVEPRPGHFAVAPAPSASSSSGNYAGRTEAHFVTTAVDASGRAVLTVTGGRTHVLVDVRGYYSSVAGGPTRGRFTPAGMGRIADTRSGRGTSAGPLGEGEARTFRHPHAHSGLVAMLAVVTAIPHSAGARSGHLTIGDASATTSDVNAYGDRAVGNTVLVPLRPDGTYTVLSARAGYDVVIDELVVFEGGYRPETFPPRYKPHPPTRVLDTRTGFGARRGPVGGTSVAVRVAGEAGVPSSVRHVLLTVTAVPTGARSGYVRTSAPHDPSQEVTALNFPQGVVTSNTVWAQLDSAGDVRVRVGAGTSHLLLDVVGAASPGPPQAGVAVADAQRQRRLHLAAAYGELVEDGHRHDAPPAAAGAHQPPRRGAAGGQRHGEHEQQAQGERPDDRREHQRDQPELRRRTHARHQHVALQAQPSVRREAHATATSRTRATASAGPTSTSGDMPPADHEPAEGARRGSARRPCSLSPASPPP